MLALIAAIVIALTASSILRRLFVPLLMAVGILVLFGGLSLPKKALAASLEDQSSPEIQRMIQQEEALNDICRGNSGDNPDTLKACELRDSFVAKLKNSGWCYGHENQVMAEREWEKCRNPIDSRSTQKLITIYFNVTPQDHPPRLNVKTNLPEGMKLQVFIQEPSSCAPNCEPIGGFFTIINGGFDVDVHLKSGRPLPSGQYKVMISSQVASSEPKNIQEIIGGKGEKITGPFVVDEPSGDHSIFFRGSLTINTGEAVGKVTPEPRQSGSSKVYNPRQGEGLTSLIPECANGVGCDDFLHRKIWKTIESDTGELVSIDTIPLSESSTGPVISAVYIGHPNDDFDPSKLKTLMFDCKGHYRDVGSGVSPVFDAAPRSVAGEMSRIACSAR